MAPRTIDVWLPPGAVAPLPVVSMHDGQNLFDAGMAYGGDVWAVDAAIEAMIAAGATTGAIVVGVWNTPSRWREYGPAGPLAALHGSDAWEQFITRAGGPPVSDDYLAFLTLELKPFIDATFATRREREATFMMGSSMGGLISLYALARNPELRGGVACLSTHWVVGGDALVDGLAAALPSPGRHRLYFDRGTTGLDAGRERFQRRMDGHVRALGFCGGRDWMSLTFDGADHTEASWRARIHWPLRFLFAPGGAVWPWTLRSGESRPTVAHLPAPLRPHPRSCATPPRCRRGLTAAPAPTRAGARRSRQPTQDRVTCSAGAGPGASDAALPAKPRGRGILTVAGVDRGCHEHQSRGNPQLGR